MVSIGPCPVRSACHCRLPIRLSSRNVKAPARDPPRLLQHRHIIAHAALKHKCKTARIVGLLLAADSVYSYAIRTQCCARNTLLRAHVPELQGQKKKNSKTNESSDVEATVVRARKRKLASNQRVHHRRRMLTSNTTATRRPIALYETLLVDMALTRVCQLSLNYRALRPIPV